MEYEILNFDKPKKVRSTEKHNKRYMSDAGIDGTYVPNMSDEDQLAWKAKYIKGKDTRVEIRKTFHFSTDKPYGHADNLNLGAQVLIIVRLPDNQRNFPVVTLSTNGKIGMLNDEYLQLIRAIEEAKIKLRLE